VAGSPLRADTGRQPQSSLRSSADRSPAAHVSDPLDLWLGRTCHIEWAKSHESRAPRRASGAHVDLGCEPIVQCPELCHRSHRVTRRVIGWTGGGCGGGTAGSRSRRVVFCESLSKDQPRLIPENLRGKQHAQVRSGQVDPKAAPTPFQAALRGSGIEPSISPATVTVFQQTTHATPARNSCRGIRSLGPPCGKGSCAHTHLPAHAGLWPDRTCSSP
jgi:hypothetical protein